MTIFKSFLTTFEAIVVFIGSWGTSKNLLEPKAEPPLRILACQNPRYAMYQLYKEIDSCSMIQINFCIPYPFNYISNLNLLLNVNERSMTLKLRSTILICFVWIISNAWLVFLSFARCRTCFWYVASDYKNILSENIKRQHKNVRKKVRKES